MRGSPDNTFSTQALTARASLLPLFSTSCSSQTEGKANNNGVLGRIYDVLRCPCTTPKVRALARTKLKFVQTEVLRADRYVVELDGGFAHNVLRY